MFVLTIKLEPTKSVVEQMKCFRNETPVLIHQHSGSITKPVQDLTTTVTPRPGNYARLNVKI